MITANAAGSKKKPAESIHLGYDTEYDTPQDSAQLPVSTQLYLHGILGVSHSQLKIKAAKVGLKLLGIREFATGVTFVFDSRGFEAGVAYASHLSQCLTLLLKEVVGFKRDRRYELNLWTLYSNAELANIFPSLVDLKELIRRQGDSSKRSPGNLKIVTIQKSAYVDNYRLGLPKGVKAIFRDIRHLLFKPSLDALGKQIGIAKLEHPNWEEVSASEWLRFDEEAFINYSATDAMIPCVAGVNFRENMRSFVEELVDADVVDKGRTVDKLLGSTPITAAGISDKLVKAHWEYKGVWSRYEEFTKDLLENWLPPSAQRTKGGFNKYYLSDRPTHQSNVDIYDVKSQYATAMAILKVPIIPPTPRVLSGGLLPVKDVLNSIKDLDLALLYLDWELPLDSDEWQRSVVAYDESGDGCTLRKADKQWLTHWELQVLACTSPDALVRVHQCLGWHLVLENEHYISIRDYIESVTSLRNKYKKVFKDSGKTDKVAELMSDTIKLIGNGTAGKFGQCKAGLDPDSLHETLYKGGIVSNTANGQTFRAAISNPLIFNLITGMARSFTSYSAWLNRASMVVTDSMVINSGAFKDPSCNLSPYRQLNDLLTTFEFDLEYEQKNIIIFKERDYAVFELNGDYVEPLEESLKVGECLLEDSSYEVIKVAKRGWKAPSDLSSRESSRKFFKDGFARYQGQPLRFQKKNLLGMKEFLIGVGQLNSRTESPSAIGSHNLRYQCDDSREFRRRKLLKELCRRKGYADALHCIQESPELHQELVVKAVPKPHKKSSVPLEVQRALVVSHKFKPNDYSFRKLEELTGIGKSTIQRWVKAVERSGIYESIKDGFAGDEIAESVMLRWFKPDCPTFLLGDGDPQVESGTHPHLRKSTR